MGTLRHNLGNIISVPLTMACLLLKKAVYPKNLFFTGIERFSPGVVVDTDKKSSVAFGKRVRMHSRCRVTATCGGNISIGDNTFFNVGCIVTARSRISIGNNVAFGPNVLVYDHDHIMNPENGAGTGSYHLGDVEIGDNTWIGAGTIILRGTHIGKNCVIAAGSVVKGDIPDNTRLIQKRTSILKRT